jgi:hypothetical protein
MNIKNKSPRDIKTNNPQQEAAIGKCGDAVPPARSGKPRAFVRPMFVITGVTLCMSLASCVVPYDSHGGGSVSVTRYSPGYRINSLPGGYRSENISGSTYYYHDGYYYRPGSGGYVVVDAPRTSRYYDDYSRRHQTYQSGRDYQGSSDRHDGRYDRGEVITRLPEGYRVVNHRGETYYQTGDRYYRRQGETYIIASRPY